MKGQKLFPKERWKEWEGLVRERVNDIELRRKEEEPVKEESQFEDKIAVMRSSRTKDRKWRKKIKEWIEALGKDQRKRKKKCERYRWEYHRPRIRDPETMEVQVITNNAKEEMREWDILRIPVQHEYQLKEIYHKVRAR
jgi:hypothetical protein